MLTVTKDGQVIGDYWGGLQQVERQRSKALVATRESQQSQDFITATATAENRKAQAKEKKELPTAAKASNRKPTLYDLHKDRVGELYAQGWTPRQIEAEIEISKRSIQRILARLVKEM